MGDRSERPGPTNDELVYKLLKPGFVLAMGFGGYLLQANSSEPTCTLPIIGLVGGVAILGLAKFVNRDRVD